MKEIKNSTIVNKPVEFDHKNVTYSKKIFFVRDDIMIKKRLLNYMFHCENGFCSILDEETKFTHHAY